MICSLQRAQPRSNPSGGTSLQFWGVCLRVQLQARIQNEPNRQVLGLVNNKKIGSLGRSDAWEGTVQELFLIHKSDVVVINVEKVGDRVEKAEQPTNQQPDRLHSPRLTLALALSLYTGGAFDVLYFVNDVDTFAVERKYQIMTEAEEIFFRGKFLFWLNSWLLTDRREYEL